VRFISRKKGEPGWMLEWRLEAFRRWKTMTEPTWANVRYPKIDFQNLYYYAAPKSTEGPRSLEEVDPELLRTYEKLGIPLKEREILAGVKGARVAVDAVFDSVSVVTTFKAELAKAGGDLLLDFGSPARAPAAGAEVLGLGGAAVGQFLCGPQLGGVFRRFLRLRPAGVRCPMELSHLLPDQREADRPVRAHLDHRRQGRLCVLPRRLHGTDAR
jgi:Fe-S cluster assembly protein SufB